MPAVSKKQQRFMGMVHALNKGEIKPSDVSKDVQDVAKDMKKKDAKDFASTKHKGLPMKKEQMINRLKEMIKQELSEYTYGVGDIVKDVNPSCLHYGAIGKVKEVNPEYVTFVVTNNGDNFSKGQTLEKSHDQMKKVNESINESKKEKDQIIKYLRGLGFDERTAKNAVAKSYDYISKAYRNIGTRYKGDLIANILNKKESVNEANPKDTIATIDMVNALLKIKSPMSRQTLDALKMMVRHYGLDNIKKEVQRDARKFYKSLQKMEKGLTQDIELESIIKEDYFVRSGEEFSKNFLTGLDLVISQANNLKGVLSKHPVKRDINKLKAVQTIYKKFLQPSIDKRTDRFKAVDLTKVKKDLQDGKFRNALEYEILSALSTSSYNSNSYYFLDNKQQELVKKLSSSLKDLTNKLDKAQLESVNESKNPAKLIKSKGSGTFSGNYVFVKKTNVGYMYQQAGRSGKPLKNGNKEYFTFKHYEDEVEKGKNYDIVRESVNENLRPSDKKILMVLAMGFLKWSMEKFGKEATQKVLKQGTLPQMLSVAGRPEDPRYNKYKSSFQIPVFRDQNDKLLSRLSSGFDKLSNSDKNSFVKTAIKNVGLKESVNEGEGVDKIMKIVDTQSFGKLAGQTVDTLSASLFKQVYDKASQGAKDKINQMNERQLLVFMNKLWMRFGKGLSGQMMS